MNFASKSIYKVFMTLFMAIALFGSCDQAATNKATASFYYWKSVFRLGDAERKAMAALEVKNLYIKFFDVVWEASAKKAVPVAVIQFEDSIPAGTTVIPTIFITNETLEQLSDSALAPLATNLVQFVQQLCTRENLQLIPELQIDCDWTATTRDRYFSLLRKIRKEPFLQQKTLSATIRLYQLKFAHKTGIPPVDRGLLMCYNMGNLKSPATKNSIIEAAELRKYIANLAGYKLPMDVALPLFDWYVWFGEYQYKGLIRSEALPALPLKNNRVKFAKDTTINGYDFKRNDVLRFENSPLAEINTVADAVREKLPDKPFRVSFYHLDATTLSHYDIKELEKTIGRFR
jgi:hypothetical protein